MILRQTLKRGGAAVVACMGLAGLMISCDSDFDLSNINTDITVGGSIAAPIGATDTLTLSRLIDLTDNLKVDENGAYALTSNGSTVLDIDRIDHVQIKDLSTTPEYFNFSVPSIPGTLPTLDHADERDDDNQRHSEYADRSGAYHVAKRQSGSHYRAS